MYNAKLRMAHYISHNFFDHNYFMSKWITVVILELIHANISCSKYIYIYIYKYIYARVHLLD